MDRDIRPLESEAEVDAEVAAAREESLDASVAVLLMLDAGLRLGEVRGLMWGVRNRGAGDEDRTRDHLVGNEIPTKRNPTK